MLVTIRLLNISKLLEFSLVVLDPNNIKWFSEKDSSNRFWYSLTCLKLKPEKAPSGQIKRVFLFASGSLYSISFDI